MPKRIKKKQPGIKTAEEMMEHIKDYCSRCDFDEDCPDRYSNIRFYVNDLTFLAKEEKEYDYSKPFVDFFCFKADIRNFVKKWPTREYDLSDSGMRR